MIQMSTHAPLGAAVPATRINGHPYNLPILSEAGLASLIGHAETRFRAAHEDMEKLREEQGRRAYAGQLTLVPEYDDAA
jgi:hypothetical protein